MKALIIGGRGMVGRQLVELCSKVYDEVCVADIGFSVPQDLPDNVDSQVRYTYENIYGNQQRVLGETNAKNLRESFESKNNEEVDKKDAKKLTLSKEDAESINNLVK